MSALGRDALLPECWIFPGFKEGFLVPCIKLNLIFGSKFAFELSEALLVKINALWAAKLPAPHPALGAASVRQLCLVSGTSSLMRGCEHSWSGPQMSQTAEMVSAEIFRLY